MKRGGELLEVLRARGEVWTAAERPGAQAQPSVGPLGRLLPAGWPRGTLIEVLSTGPGFGEVSLFTALAAAFTRGGCEVAWVAPEGMPSAPALAAAGIDLAHFLWARTREGRDAGWVARELLASGAVPLVLVGRAGDDPRILRGLAVAAREGGALGVLLRDASRRAAASPAQLRLEFPPGPQRPRRLVVLKGRGLAPGTALTLDA